MKKMILGIVAVAITAWVGCASSPRLTSDQRTAQTAWEAANPQYTSAAHFGWREVDGGIRITRYTGPGGNVRIPPQINGMPVTEITGRGHFPGDIVPFRIGAFHGRGLTGVTIPDSVTYIGGGAFARNRITSLDIPDGVTNIARGAFSFNPLTGNVIIPAGARVGTNAFQRNRDVHGNVVLATPTRVTPEERLLIAQQPAELQRLQSEQTPVAQGAGDLRLPQYRGFEWRRNGAGTGIIIVGWVPGPGRDIVIPAQIEGLPVVSVNIDQSRVTWERNPPDWRLERRNITSVSIPDTVTFIGEGTFYRNIITDITIPSSVTTIGPEAFAANRIASLTILNGVTRIGENAFAANQLTSVTIPDSVTRIDRWAFGNNPLTSITIGDGIGSIHENVFQGSLRGVTRISIGANVNLQGNSEVVWRMFQDAYLANGAQAGVYTLSGGNWTRQPR